MRNFRSIGSIFPCVVIAGIAALGGCQAIAGIEDLHVRDDGGDDDSTLGDTSIDVEDSAARDSTLDSKIDSNASPDADSDVSTEVDGGGDSTLIADSDSATDTTTRDSVATDTTTPRDTTPPDTTPPIDTAPPPCPTGGQAMVRVTSASSSFCIDVNEVTIKAMDDYNTSGFSPPVAPLICGGSIPTWNNSTGADPADPAFNIQWCTAWAYCQSVGKQLCGRLDTSSALSATNSQYAYACSNGATGTVYPYGAGYAAGRCDVESGRDTPQIVTLEPNCKGLSAPYDKVFNLSGSIAEWTDDCPTSGECWVRGGYFGDIDTNARCASFFSLTINVEQAGTGFRCCK